MINSSEEITKIKEISRLFTACTKSQISKELTLNGTLRDYNLVGIQRHRIVGRVYSQTHKSL